MVSVAVFVVKGHCICVALFLFYIFYRSVMQIAVDGYVTVIIVRYTLVILFSYYEFSCHSCASIRSFSGLRGLESPEKITNEATVFKYFYCGGIYNLQKMGGTAYSLKIK